MAVNFNDLSSSLKLIYIFKNILFPICLIGIIGNIFTFCVFTRSRFKNLSFSFYAKIMAVNDILILTLTLNNWTSLMVDFDLNLTSPITCSLRTYLTVTSTSISIWLLESIAFDRWISISHPIYNTTLKNPKFKVALVLTIYICNYMLNLPMALNYILVHVNQTNTVICVAKNSEAGSLFSWLIFGNVFSVSFVINNFLVVMIWIALIRSRQILMITNNIARINRDKKFGVTSIILNMVCFIFKMPLSIYMIINYYMNSDFVTFQFYMNMFMVFYVFDNAAAFFINMWANSLFRKDFWAMMVTLQRQ
jgi:hypothetical protein